MKFVILFALVAAALAQDSQSNLGIRNIDHDSELVQEIIESPVGAAYSFLYELKNGVRFEETGSTGSAGQAIVVGRYYYVSPEGDPIEVTYTADENGFVAKSDAIPVDHALPAHVEELLRIADQQRAEGVQFDAQGFRI